MPQPTSTSAHIDGPLSNLSVATLQDAAGFIASKVFPIVPVDKQSDKYFVYPKNDWQRIEMQRRAAGTESAGSGYTLSTDSYLCEKYALHKDIDDDLRANADDPLDVDREATDWLTQQSLLKLERQFASDFFTTGVWATDKVGTTDFTKWSDYSASNPVKDIRAGKRAVTLATGLKPNTLVINYDVRDCLIDHPDILGRKVPTSSDVPDEAFLASVLGVERVLVGETIYATNKENGTAATSFQFGKNALLTYTAPSPGLRTQSAAYTFAWKGVSGGLGLTAGVKRFRLEQIESDRVEINMAWDNKVIDSALGYFFSAAVA